MTAPRRWRTMLLGWLLAAGALTGGCHAPLLLPLAFLEKMFPKDRVPPKFKLPAGKKVLVFPDDMLRPMSYPPAKRTLARKANALLVEKKLVAGTVPYDRLIDLQHDDVNFNRRSVATVGRKLGADLVIYISIDEFALKDSPVGTLWHGRFAGKVRVVDVVKGRLWPDESAGFPVRVEEPITENASETYGTQLAQKLAERLAEEVVGLFHSHYVDRHRPRQSEPRGLQ